jgi:hypothetical protein
MALRLLAIPTVYVVSLAYLFDLVKLPQAVLQVDKAIILNLFVLC